MSSFPGAQQTLELLVRLKGVVHDFAAREEKLNSESALETARIRHRCDKAIEGEEARLAAEIGRATESFDAEKSGVDSCFESRKSRISQANKAATRHRLQQIEDDESRGKYLLQRDLLQTSRTRESSLKETEAGFEAFTADHAAERDALAELEQRAWSSFRGYGRFRRMLSNPPEAGVGDETADHLQLLEKLRLLRDEVDAGLNRFRRMLLPLLFRLLPLWLLVGIIVLGHGLLAPALEYFGREPISYEDAAISLIAFLAGLLLLYFAGRRRAAPVAAEIVAALRQARTLDAACEARAASDYEQEIERIKREGDARNAALEAEWNQTLATASEQREHWTGKLETQRERVTAKCEELHRARIARLEATHAARISRLRAKAANQMEALEAERAAQEQELKERFDAEWGAVATEWQAQIQPIYHAIQDATVSAQKHFPDWTESFCREWKAPEDFVHAAQFAQMAVNVEKLAGKAPRDERLSFPGPMHFEVPLVLTLPDQGSLLVETRTSGREAAIRALNNVVLRFLSVAPPGKLSFTILDPLELGQNFAGFMHLADYEERLINSRIWTQSNHIEQQLANLNEHIEKVTQMYLRNEYETITDYNKQAGRIAEKYQFLVIADFPASFSDLAIKRLLSIAASGPRCGVYTLIHWDPRKAADVAPEELKKSSVWLQAAGSGFRLAGRFLEGTTLRLDAPPEPEPATEFLHQVGRSSIDSNRVEIPFADIAPPEEQLWREDTSVEVRVPIGRTGATKLQYLALGKGTCQHALIAGKTGSGKSTLFHVIITNLALWCSPEQVEFYLVDFKKGVEFKCYATSRLPHARVVAIESDREFGLSVLQRVDDELKRRGDLFRRLGVQDVAGYKKAGATEAIPRTLLIIDEFQEFFVEDDRVAQSASLMLDRIVRQGRAFGIHVLLGSQTLGGAYTLARTTLGQMAVRIALQCNEADAYLIMDDENPAPRLLSRPGEAIYNDTSGTIEGNSPFQVVWLPDEVRETYLAKARALGVRAGMVSAPIVFEGNAPADVRENAPLHRFLEAPSVEPVTAARAWLGAPNSIKGPTEAIFHSQSGSNLLVVGQRDEATLAMLGVSLLSLAAQHPRGTARFVVFDCSPPGTRGREFMERIVRAIPHDCTLMRNFEIDETMTGLAEELERRSHAESTVGAPVTYLFVHDLQRFKKLRYEEDFGFSLDEKKAPPPGLQFNQVICEGPGLGFHVICACDTVNNVNRFLSRKAISEFEMRVLFQMSANDSALLMDSARAATLGMHRAIFYNQQEGYLETFRPYALPADGWIKEAARKLSRR